MLSPLMRRVGSSNITTKPGRAYHWSGSLQCDDPASSQAGKRTQDCTMYKNVFSQQPSHKPPVKCPDVGTKSVEVNLPQAITSLPPDVTPAVQFNSPDVGRKARD